MKIGDFTKNDAGYLGDITTFGLRVAGVTIRPVAEKKGEGPDFIVLAGNQAGETYELGAGWLETAATGKPYIALKLDSPTFAEPIQCALTRPQEGTYTLVWSRRKKRKEKEVTDEAAAAF